MAQTIKLKRSSVSGNTPGTSDLELGEVAINTYDGKMFIKKNDGSDSIVEIGGTSGTVTEAFKNIAVSGQSNVVADSATDTLTLVAGSNMTITTSAAGDSITFASSGGGGTQNVFNTFAVSGQSSVVADSTTDTLTFAAGSGINITTNAGTDTITIAATASAITVQDEGSSLSTAATTLNFVGAGVTASGTGATKTITIGGGGGSQNLFSNIGVSGQGTIQADATTDTLTVVAGSGISLTTDTSADSLTITNTGTVNVANAASTIKEFKYDISSSTTTITGSDANSNTLAYEAGALQVFLNGILLDPATDYTASNGTSVVLTDAAVNGDDVQIVSFNRKIVTANVGLSTFTGDGTTTAFTLSSDPVNENNTRVHIDGVYQEKAAYSVSGTTLTFSGAPPNGSSIEVEIGFTQAEIGSTLDFADNAILRVGTGNDLQILHDGSNSIIKDTGTGDLQIAASTLEVKNSGLSETMLKAIQDGAVELYHDNNKKLETVTGGVTITGTVTATTFSGDLSGTINTATTGATQSASDNSTKLATTAYVTTALSNLVDSAPGTLNTLNELAAALGDDANFSTTITNSLATKVGLTATTGAANMPAGTTAQRPGSPAAGQFRYNSTLSQFEGYTSSWGAIGGGGTNTFTTDTLTTSGSATVTLSQAVSSPNDCIVHIDGIYQTPTDAYTVSGTTLTFTATPASGRKVVVYSVKAGVSGNNLNVQSINGNGTDHTFTLNVNPINENNTIIHIDGVYQQKSSYTVSGTSLSFGSGNIPANGTVIEVATFTQTEINVPVNDTIDTVHIKDDAVTSAKLGGNLVAPGTVTASSGFVGPLTGNVTGNVSGTAATVTVAAQTNITSLGTLTGLTVTGNLTANSLFAAKTSSGIGNTGLEVFSTGQTYITRAGGPLALNNTSGVGGQIYLYAGGTYTANISTVSGGISFGTGAGGSVTDNRMTLDASGNLAVTGTIATGGITINGAGSTISDSSDLGIVSGGTLTMDVAGNIILDADGGEIQLKDGGTEFGQLVKSGNDFRINQSIQDGDIVFRGNDGGSVITAMTIDMSEAGKVGMGITNPAAALNISSTTGNLLTIQNSTYQGSGQNTEAILRFKAGSGTDDERAKGGILFKNDGSAFGRGDLHFLVDSNDDNGNAIFADSKMVISHEGNVGIGTPSPAAKLNVNWVGSNISTDNIARITAPIYPSLEFYSTNTNSGNRNWKIAGVHNAYGRFEILRSSAANGVANVSTFAIDSLGNFGFAATPTTAYQVKLNGGISLSAKSLIDNSAYFISGTNGFRWNNSTDAYNNCIMYDNGNMYVRSNVGIGTTAPDLPLHVNGTNALPATSGTTPNGMLTLRNKAGSASHGLYMGVSNASPWGSWLQAADAGNLATEYPLLLNPNGGNVGIGTSNPTRKLHMVKDDTTTYAGNSAGTNIALHLANTSSGAAGRTIGIGMSSESNAEVYLNCVTAANNNGGDFVIASRSGGRSEKMRLHAAGSVTKPLNPSFQARFPAVTNGGNATIVFSSTHHNIGTHYSTSNGIFTAPVAGSYLFAFAILMNPSGLGHYARVAFAKNGTTADQTYGDTLESSEYQTTIQDYQSLSMTAVIYLNANDTIRLQNTGQSPTYGTSYGSFSGYLLG